MSRPLRSVDLSARELARLEEIIDSLSPLSRSYRRARALNALQFGYPIDEISKALGISEGTVSNIKSRFFNGGVERAVFDSPRSGAPKKDDSVAKLAVLLLAELPPPQGKKRWSLRLLAQEVVARLDELEAISHSQVAIILRDAGVKLKK